MKNQDLFSKVLRTVGRQSLKFSERCRNLEHHRHLDKTSLGLTKSIPTHMTRRELNNLYDLAARSGASARVLEIGSYLGASSCYIAAAIAQNNGHLFCVDTWENQTMPEGERDTFGEFVRNTSAVAKYLTPIRKNSRDLMESDIIFPLNLVFIDGDHSYASVKSDYGKVSTWIAEGGILAFHDCIHFEGVSKTIGEALASGEWQFVDHVDNLLWLRKLVKGRIDFNHPV